MDIVLSDNISTEQLRLLRISWEMHNEREGLRLVLNAGLQKRIEPAQPAFRDYLACQSARLRQAKRHGLPQADLLAQAYAHERWTSEIRLLQPDPEWGATGWPNPLS